MTSGSLPSTRDASQPVVSGMSAETLELAARVCSATGVVWVRPLDDERTHLAWQVWHDGAIHIVSGAGEQRIPLLLGTVEVMVPGKGVPARSLTMTARAEALNPGTSAWEAAADALAAKRLNAVETHAEAAAQRSRWASTCVITRLTPLRVTGSGPGSSAPLDDAPPRPSSATTLHRRPWHLGGRANRRTRS